LIWVSFLYLAGLELSVKEYWFQTNYECFHKFQVFTFIKKCGKQPFLSFLSDFCGKSQCQLCFLSKKDILFTLHTFVGSDEIFFRVFLIFKSITQLPYHDIFIFLNKSLPQSNLSLSQANDFKYMNSLVLFLSREICLVWPSTKWLAILLHMMLLRMCRVL